MFPTTHHVSSTICRTQYPPCISPWLTAIAYPLLRYGVMPTCFKSITAIGQEHVPTTGPVILAPTHRSRWDALVVAYAVGRHATGRDVRFMVTADEMDGIQGWLIRQLGGFPVNPRQPAIASLRFGLDILKNNGMMVLFPEGAIFRDRRLHPLKPGLARLAIQAQNFCLTTDAKTDVKIVPIDLTYSDPIPSWKTSITVKLGRPIHVKSYCSTSAALESCKHQAKQLTIDIVAALEALNTHFDESLLQ